MIKKTKITKEDRLSNTCNQDIDQKTKSISKNQPKNSLMDLKKKREFAMDVAKYLLTSKLQYL
jgi:hypothetical protein